MLIELEKELEKLGFIKKSWNINMDNCNGIFWCYEGIQDWIIFWNPYNQNFQVATSLKSFDDYIITTSHSCILSERKVIKKAKNIIRLYKECLVKRKEKTIKEIS